MIPLNTSMKNRFKHKLSSYHQSLIPFIKDEEDFIDRTVKAFKNYADYGGGQSIRTRTVKIHGKPIVCFGPCTSRFPSRKICREMGDLLFIYKHFFKGNVDAHRAVLVQTKYTGSAKRTWSIETGQFCLMTLWPKFSVTRPTGFSNDLELRPKTLTWSTYGFVGPRAVNYPFYFSSTRILRTHRQQASSTKHFSFTLRSNPIPWDYSAGFLSRFVNALIGENLFANSAIKTFIDDLYKVAGWIPDPPGEFEWRNEKIQKEGSLGIIEFVVIEEGEE